MSMNDVFPLLTGWGNYERGKVPRKGVTQVPLDGTIRCARQLNIPIAPIVALDYSGYYPRHVTVSWAIPSSEARRFRRAVAKAKARKATKCEPSPHSDILLCVREASRAAHRERDAAQDAYENGLHRNAKLHSLRKNEWYRLKDAGIIVLHRRGVLRYVGASPQGMAVYEYGDGGMACFHSTLHPAGVERKTIDGHPETLLVAAQEKQRGISEMRVRVTLKALPGSTEGYERSAAPSIRRTITCYECGGEGHIARDCPELWPGNDADDDYLEGMTAA